MESLDPAPVSGRYTNPPSQLEFFQIIEQAVRQTKGLSCVVAVHPVIPFTRLDPANLSDSPGQRATWLTGYSCVHHALMIREAPDRGQGQQALHPQDEWVAANLFSLGRRGPPYSGAFVPSRRRANAACSTARNAR